MLQANTRQDIIVADTEFTAWEGSMRRGWKGPGEQLELIQIGAVRLDGETYAEKDSLSVYIKPTINPILSDYIIDLTGITNEILNDKGVSFEVAMKTFLLFISDANKVHFHGKDENVLTGC